MNTMTEKADDREEIETLLPWHAAGTLNRRDAERVERALATDQELARRFTLVREELAETIHLNESLGAPSARAMEKLSPEHREIVDLVYYHEKSVEEVAEIVGIPENTVKTRMFYARKKLAELLKAAGVERGWP